MTLLNARRRVCAPSPKVRLLAPTQGQLYCSARPFRLQFLEFQYQGYQGYHQRRAP